MVLAGGCASGGGGSGGSGPASDANRPPPAPTEPSPCGTVNGYPVQCVPYLPFGGQRSGPPSTPVAPYAPRAWFKSWSEMPRDTHTAVPSDVVTESAYSTRHENFGEPAFRWKQGPILSVSELPPASGTRMADTNVRYDATGKFVHFSAADHQRDVTIHFYYPVMSLAGLGQPSIDITTGPSATTGSSVPWGYPTTGVAKTPFLGLHADTVALVANPYSAEWDYQSFGVWNRNSWMGGRIGATSFGSPTPGSAVPTSGSSTFAGKLAGFYVSPTGLGSAAAADVSVRADFSSRSLSFASSGTRTSLGATSSLNLAGTLSYAPGSNAFGGTLANAGGTLSGRSSGQFYGPAAQELGGVFNLKSSATPEAFVGAYGAKRQ